jgi:hypothetical protein
MNLIGQFILHSLYGVTIYFADPAQNQYINSKWISPVTEDCYDTLCFNSERTVLFYSCKEDFHAELGYNVKDGIIEVEAYGQSDMNPKSKLILKEDQGILRQLSTQQNSFPLNFIKIPEGKCE